MPWKVHIGIASGALALIGAAFLATFNAVDARPIFGGLCVALLAWLLVAVKAKRFEPNEDHAAEWKDLASKFQAFGGNVGADWLEDENGIGWELVGPDKTHIADCEALSQLAGARLLASPKVALTLDAQIRSEPAPIVRWLRFVAGTSGMEPQVSIETIHSDGRPPDQFSSGRIKAFDRKAARACLDCSTRELEK